MIEEDDKGRVINLIWVKGCVYHIIDFYWGLTDVSGDIIIFQEKGFHVEEGDCGVFQDIDTQRTHYMITKFSQTKENTNKFWSHRATRVS